MHVVLQTGEVECGVMVAGQTPLQRKSLPGFVYGVASFHAQFSCIVYLTIDCLKRL